MQRAWKQNLQAYEKADKNSQVRANAHRLLLFYSVECGLKATLMRDDKKTSTLNCPQIIGCGHDINGLLDALNVQQNLRLPRIIRMINDRQVSVHEINQMWRYGGAALNDRSTNNPTDQELESHLLKISAWIKQELN
jgi:hypothetical protein